MSTFIGLIKKNNSTIDGLAFKQLVALSKNHHDKELLIGIQKDLTTSVLSSNSIDEAINESVENLAGVIFLGLSNAELEQNSIQPGLSNSSNVSCVFDGEVFAYNKVDVEHSSAYAPLMAQAFENENTDAFDKLNAQFTSLLIDKRKQEITLVRDKQGQKSCFYYDSDTEIVFANSARFILGYSGYKKEINWHGVWENLSFPAPPQPLTTYKRIYALQRGHFLKITSPKSLEHQYYEIPIGHQESWDAEEAGFHINEAMLKAVKRRTKGSSSIGAPISGGVDSPYICALASEHVPKMKVYTFGLSDPAFSNMNEHEKAALTANKYDLAHDIRFYSISDLLKDYDDIIEMYEQIGNNFGTYYYVAKQAFENGTQTILTGLAADESHGGFHYFKYIKLWQWIKLLPFTTSFIPRGMNARLEDLKNLSLANSIDDYYAHAFSNLKEREKKLILPSVTGFHSHDTIHDLYNPDNKSFIDDVEGLLYFMFANVQNHHLYRFEQFSNFFGLKIRHPFLDDDVIEAAFKVPSNLKVKGDNRKIALKKAAEPYLPDESLVKKKLGLTIPLGAWLNHDIKDFADSHVSDLKSRGLFDAEGIDTLVKTYRHIKPAKLMKLVMAELWFKRFID